MKTMKRMAALVLCLSLLIGIPCAVQAVGTSGIANTFELHAVYGMNDKMATGWQYNSEMKDYSVILYMNGTDRNNWLAKNNLNNTLEIFVEPYGADGAAIGKLPCTFYSVNYYYNNLDLESGYPQYDAATWPDKTTPWYGKRVTVLQFDSAQGFSTWTDAVGFRLVIVDAASQAQDDVINGWKGQQYASQPYLKAVETYDGRDAVIREILYVNGETDYLTINSVAKVDESKVLINFSESVALAPLAGNKGPVNISLHATTGTKLNSNNDLAIGNANADATSRTVNASWMAQSARVLGDSSWVEVDFGEGKVAEAVTYAAENGNGLFLNISENNNATNPTWARHGEQVKNGIIDGIWATADNEPLVANHGKFRDSITTGGDQCYYNITSTALPAIWSDNGVYNDLNTALAAGGTVHLGADVTVSERFLEVPADVTLDLNGKNLTVPNIFSFGDIIDSTDGNGGLVISNDKEQAFVGLQETNNYLPLYDTNCYRFFDYDVVSAGKKTGTNTVKFGVKVNFDNEKAYDLLQNDGELVLDLMIGEQNIPYKFNPATMTKLYNAVKADWTNRSKYAIALTISGLDNLPSDTVITATPELTSVGVLGTDAPIEYTYTSAQ